MEIYKYKIWTGNIPGSYTQGCDSRTPITPIRNAPIRPPSLDCSQCEALGGSTDLTGPTTIMDACIDCWNGLVNVCCPRINESCCGIVKDKCEPFYAMTAAQQNEYCAKCDGSKKKHGRLEEIIGTKGFSISRHTDLDTPDPGKNYCKCCNRTGRDNHDSNLTIFLDQDLNDIGHYEIWDGMMEQQDTFANFVAVGDPLNTMVITVLNTTDFKFFKFIENIQYTVDWGDGTVPQIITAPIESTTHTYTAPNTYEINIQMSAPWGVSSVSHHITVPYQTGAALWATVINTGQTYTFTPPGFTTSVDMDYETSDWGPLDSGLDINGYITGLYTTTPYLIQGFTDSMLSSLKSYNTTSTPGLPAGYTTFPTVINIGGQSRLPDGSYVNNLQGWIDSFTSTYTAYTITNCTSSPCQTFTMFDHINGETVFETNSYGLYPEDFLTRECGYAIQGACDMCNAVQWYDDGTGQWLTQDVFNDRGVWDILEAYEPTDFVYHEGCCFFAISSVPIGEEPDILDIFSSFWRLCYGSCAVEDQLPDRYDCIDGTCILLSPTSTYYPTAQFKGIPIGCTPGINCTTTALNECVTHPCVSITPDPIHYNCVDGSCIPITPSAPGYATADYTGVGAYAACQADIAAGICVDTNIRWHCEPVPGVGPTCVPGGPTGGHATQLACQANCGGTVTLWDWYCVTVPVSNTFPTGQDCVAVQQDPAGAGIATPPPNAIIPLQGPYATKNDCNTHGCGATVSLWYCKCDLVGADAIVDLGGGSYGGNSCQEIANASIAGGFATEGECEDDCLSWDCDGHGNCTQTNLTNSAGGGEYCSDVGTNTGVLYWSDGTTVNIPGCIPECPIPTTWSCVGGTCIEILEPPHQIGCINPTHVNNTTPWNGSCIDWTYANNMPVTGCDDVPQSFCQAPLGMGGGCNGGCGPCARLTNLGFDKWPFKIYEPGTNYNPYDVVIGWTYPLATTQSDFKYWFNPRPICDPNKGVVFVGPIPYNCFDPNIIDICESAPYGFPPGNHHPCTDTTGNKPACDTIGTINSAPPTIPGQSRYDSETCWDHC